MTNSTPRWGEAIRAPAEEHGSGARGETAEELNRNQLQVQAQKLTFIKLLEAFRTVWQQARVDDPDRSAGSAARSGVRWFRWMVVVSPRLI
ncbi:hypothetical protein KCP69_01300 [Salmonella enterica subsp. enterica]|nr:hypothetical protein KCP69_01300 [Salmonella enterica subsp. enterica]